ncbi:DNA repair protein RadA [bacterium]|nr:DNA repair protein RadA [bacterium]
MSKIKPEYVCQSCGARFPKWTGRCGHCGEWDTLVEKVLETKKTWVASENHPQSLGAITVHESEERWVTQVHEFDRVVGGGIIRGSVGLLGGSPGVGKSTLILQLLARLAKNRLKVLYVSGEESANQIKHRADRLLIQQDKLLVLIASNLEQILDCLRADQPDFVVIDSIQTLYTDQLTASPGTVSQVRESAGVLMKHAKQTNTGVMLIGHVTKEGDIAGPRTLEHMVDYVLYLEGEKKEQQRILRSVKNRFGTVNEVGLFKMTAKGLVEISKPNSLFIDRFLSTHPGTAVFSAREGSRTIFLEIQVLVGDTQQNNPARTAMGMDRNRLQLIIAVLEKHLNMNFSHNDIYVNLAGGFRVFEPAIDLALMAALLSSHLNVALPEKSVFFGEISLTGEFRSVSGMEERLYESQRCGFKRVFLPAQSLKPSGMSNLTIEVNPVRDIHELREVLA